MSSDRNVATGKFAAASLPMVATLLLASCESGSLGSDVGNRENTAPLAATQILNGGPNGGNTFRTGSEVLLSGKDSEDPDGPIIAWRWTQTSGPAVELKEVTANTKSFTVPVVDDGTVFQFTLEVEDSDGATGSQSITVVASQVLDADRFLSMKLIGEPQDPNRFTVQARLSDAIAAGESPAYTLDLVAYLVYAPVGINFDCRDIGRPPTDAEATSGSISIPGAGGAECLVEQQEVLTPAGGIADEWPIGVDPASQPSDWFEPRHDFRIPVLDVALLNERVFADGRRNDKLDLYKVPGAYTSLRLEVTPASASNLAGVTVSVDDGATSVLDAPSSGAASQVEWFLLDDVNVALGNVEYEATGSAYYAGVDPNNTRWTLNRWLCNAGFGDPNDCATMPTLDVDDPTTWSAIVSLRPEAVTGTDTATERFAHATYLNNYDLGFGRDMYIRTDSSGYVYAFVNNYGTLEAAARKRDPFVSVVMEYSPPDDDPSGNAYVKFFTYAPDGSGDMLRVTSLNFDFRGELYTPGNCMGCHGGVDPAEPDTDRYPDVLATFLPWDIESFFFVEDDPAIVDAPPRLDGSTLLDELLALETYPGEFSTDNQKAQLKKLNEAALATYQGQAAQDSIQTDDAIALLRLWYGMEDGEGRFSNDFMEDQVPASWSDPDLYSDVFARQCRMCHTNMTVDGQMTSVQDLPERDRRFSSQADFDANAQRTAEIVYHSSRMPAARLTMDRMWVPQDSTEAPGDLLAAYIGTLGMPVPETPTNAVASVEPEGPLSVNRNETVSLDASDSSFAQQFAWTLSSTCDDMPPLHDQCDQDTGNLTGATTAVAAFTPNIPGTYTATLTLNPGTAAATSASTMVTVDNQPPVGIPDGYSLDLTQELVLDSTQDSPTDILQNDNDPESDSLVAGQVIDPLDPTIGPFYGTVLLNPDGTFVYTFTGNDPLNPPSSSDSFVYRATDEYNASSQPTTVNIALVGDETPPSVPQNLAGADASTAGSASEFRIALDWSDSVDPENNGVSYLVYRFPGNGTTTPHDASASSSYTDTNLSDDTLYTYWVSSVDSAGNESNLTSPVNVTTDISYRLTVDGIWANRNCNTCHSGDAPPATTAPLRFDQNVALNYDCITGNGCADTTGTPFPNQRDRTSPGDSTALVVCKPGGTCGFHPGPGTIGIDSDYARILRWVQQGAAFN